MKRLGVALTGLICTFLIVGNVYAIENVEDTTNNISYNGRFVITFYTNDGSSLQGVELEMFYSSTDGMINIKDVEEISSNITINLVSDINGKIVLNKLPYGLYQYKIINAPIGIEYSEDLTNVVIDLLNKNINLESYLNTKVEMAPEVPDPVEPPIEEPEEDIKDEGNEEVLEDTTPPIIEDGNEEEYEEEPVVKEEIISEENNTQVTIEKSEIKDTQLSNIIVNKEQKENYIKKDNKKDVDYKFEEVKERNFKSNIEIIKNKNYCFNDSIKFAIVDVDNNINHYTKLLVDIPNNYKYKKFNKVERTTFNVKDIFKKEPIINHRLNINMG